MRAAKHQERKRERLRGSLISSGEKSRKTSGTRVLNCLLITKVLQLKMTNLSDLVGFALTVTLLHVIRSQEWKAHYDRSEQKLELPSFQIEHKINLKVDASS